MALCDPDGILASPLTVLRTQKKDFLARIRDLLNEHEPIHIYVGLPVKMSGNQGSSVEKVNLFVSELEKLADIPISLIDERLSSVSAQKKLKEAGVSTRDSKSLIDAMAAVAILEQGLAHEK